MPAKCARRSGRHRSVCRTSEPADSRTDSMDCARSCLRSTLCIRTTRGSLRFRSLSFGLFSQGVLCALCSSVWDISYVPCRAGSVICQCRKSFRPCRSGARRGIFLPSIRLYGLFRQRSWSIRSRCRGRLSSCRCRSCRPCRSICRGLLPPVYR